MTRVLIGGVSTRAAAESAARAGFRVTAIDAYADLDQHAAVRALSVVRDFRLSASATGLARASRRIEADAVAYLSSFENHPAAVAMLAAGRTLWGNPPQVLHEVRNPLRLADAFRRRGFAVPALRTSVPDDGEEWLEKPTRSGGGQRVRAWGRRRLGRGSYLQQRIEGTPGSIVFVAADGRAVPLGVSRQLVGDAHFGAAGYRYCGNILAAAADPQFDRGRAVIDAACALAEAAASEFALVGVNGIDFVAAGGVPYPIELNPRWSASLELVERRLGWPMFRAHADACTTASLPAFDLRAELASGGAWGKAIVFARDDAAVGDTRRWLDDATVRDVPHPGERFNAGQPVCTVLATGPDAAACYEALVARASRVYAELEAPATAARARRTTILMTILPM